MKLKNLYASSERAIMNRFLGINRRIRTSAGEFSDMENLSHDEYPCIKSLKGALETDFTLPEGVEAVKMILPKRLQGEVSGFSGVVRNSNTNMYEIYINGEAKRTDIKYFSDAVDYNGTIIVMPELKGYCYSTKVDKNGIKTGSKLEPVSYTGKMYFSTFYININGNVSDHDIIKSSFAVGDEIILTGLTGDFEGNNTIFPESSLDYSNTKSPVNIVITSINYSGGTYSGTIKIGIQLQNSLGGSIDWPYRSDTVSARGTITKRIPYSTYGCVAHNRLWLCSHDGETIYSSSVGTPLEFYNLAGLSSDIWNSLTGTPGKFTGIASWQKRVVVFKPDIIHVVYGNLPTSFGIEKTYAAGCIDGSSIANVNGKLIWLYYDGFYSYSGNRPQRISDKLHTKYISCKAFSDGRRYYARCVKENGEGEFLIYDSELDLWSKLSDIDVISGDYYGGKVYVCDKTKVYCLGEGEYRDFYCETPELTFDSFMDKSVIYITVRCIIETGFLNVYTSVNNGEWMPHKGIQKTGKHRLPVRYAPGDILRLRLEGSGNVCITEIELEVLTKEV
ncbi:MAG: hypothetical protein IJ300_00380 [Clostridia bacterium]|nr:hypothetical protein [Clostridia bacterium]